MKYYKCEEEICLIPCTDFKNGKMFHYLRITTDNSFGFIIGKDFETVKEVYEYMDKIAGILNFKEIQ